MSVHHTPVTRTIRRTIGVFEIIGLVIIAIATVYAGYAEVMHMVSNATVTLGDLLLLFLYLEVLAMVAIYLDSGKLPFVFHSILPLLQWRVI